MDVLKVLWSVFFYPSGFPVKVCYRKLKTLSSALRKNYKLFPFQELLQLHAVFIFAFLGVMQTTCIGLDSGESD